MLKKIVCEQSNKVEVSKFLAFWVMKAVPKFRPFHGAGVGVFLFDTEYFLHPMRF